MVAFHRFRGPVCHSQRCRSAPAEGDERRGGHECENCDDERRHGDPRGASLFSESSVGLVQLRAITFITGYRRD